MTRVYIFNLSTSGSTQCSAGVCIVDPVSPVNCAGNGNCVFANANVQVGENNHNIHVAGVTIKDGSGYRLLLSSSREDSSASTTLGQSIFSAPLVHRTLTIPTQLMDHSTSN